MPRSCSFCRRSGHNILTCNDTQLSNFELMCINNISNTTSEINIESSFRNFLLSECLYYQNLVKSFAIRYCRASSRGNIGMYIENIIQDFKPIMEYRRIQLSIIQNTSEQLLNPPVQTLPIHQISRPEEPLSPYYQSFINNPHRNQITSIAYSLLFMEMIMSIHDEANTNINLNKKFNINTKICECKIVENCDCNICYETIENKNFIKLNCGHEFCKSCIKKTLENEKKNNPSCAFCRAEINEFEISNNEIREEFNGLIV